MSCNYRIEVSRDAFGTQSWWVSPLLSLESTRVVKVEIWRFLFVSRDFVGGVLPPQVTTLPSLGFIGLVKVKIQRVLFVTLPLVRCVTRLYGWGPLILIHHTAKFGVHKSWKWKYTGFYLSRDHNIKVSRDCVGGVLSS